MALLPRLSGAGARSVSRSPIEARNRAAIAHHAPEAGDWPELFAPERVRDCVSISQPSHISCVRTAICARWGGRSLKGRDLVPVSRRCGIRPRVFGSGRCRTPASAESHQWIRQGVWAARPNCTRAYRSTSTAFDLAFPWCARCGVFVLGQRVIERDFLVGEAVSSPRVRAVRMSLASLISSSST